MAGERKLLRILQRQARTLAVAESFTGGLVQDRLTDVPGASRVFVGGIVAYADAVKVRLVGVPAALIRRHGAVSHEVAAAMAVGVRRRLGASVGLATTGIAGPGGATPTKPVGLSFVAASIGRHTWVERRVLQGSRLRIKERASNQVVALAIRKLARKR